MPKIKPPFQAAAQEKQKQGAPTPRRKYNTLSPEVAKRLEPFEPGYQFATMEEWKEWVAREGILKPLFDLLRKMDVKTT